MPDLAVTTAFDAKGNILKALKTLDTKVDKFGNSAQRAFKKANKGANSFKTVMKGVLAAGLVTKGLAALRQGLTATATEFLGFDQAITSAAAKFKDVNLATADGRAKFEQLKQTARETGATTEFSAGQAAQGLKFMSLAGFNSAQAMSNLGNLTNFATSAEIDLARASDIATDSLGAFGLMTDDTVQLQKNFTRQNDVMALAMARSNVGAEDFFETVKRSGATFTATGQRLETFATLTGIMADAGKKGGDAGTVLNNMMLKLAKPTGEAAKAIDMMGIKTTDAKGNFRDIVDILADVKKGTEGMGTAQRSAALDLIFGKRAITGVNILLEKGIPAIRAYREEMDNAAGSSKKMADIMRGSLTNQLAGLKSAALEVGFQFFEAFSGEGSSGITKFTEILRGIDLKPLIENVKSVFGVIKTGIDFVITKGTESGFFDNVATLFKDDLIPLFNQWWDIMKSVFKLLETSGAIDLMIFSLNLMVDAVRLVSQLISGLWSILKPIIDATTTFIKFMQTIPQDQREAGAKRQQEFMQGGGFARAFSKNIPEQPQKEQTEPTPQQKEARARAQQFTLNQSLEVNNAPAGTTVESKTTSAPQLTPAGGANIQYNTQRFGR